MNHFEYIHKLRREKIKEKLEDFCRIEGIALLSIKIDWNNNEIGSLHISPDGNMLYWINQADTVIINKIKCMQ